MTELTPKQKAFFNAKLKRINILQGSVSSGKTFVSLCKWGWRVRLAPESSVFLMVGKTQTTLKRNCLVPLQMLFGSANFKFSMTTKTANLFGRLIYLEGADNEKAEDKIRGLTLDGAYLDEVTLMPESFFRMLLSRLRKAGSFVIGTTNPDTPMHWLKTDFIDRKEDLDCDVWDFMLEDNTNLPADYVENIKKEYTGLFYKRFILGQWVLADGLVFSSFNEEKMLIPTPTVEEINREYAERYISMDYGIENPTAMLLLAWHVKKAEWHVVREYYYGGRDNLIPKSDAELYQDLLNFSAGILGINGLVVDPSAKSFIVMAQKYGQFRVQTADNDVLPGISFTNTLFSQGKLKICSCCTSLRKELFAYSWDTDKSRKTGKDTVIKQNDHACDALRYHCYTIVKPKTRIYGVVTPTTDNLNKRSFL